MDNFVLTVNDTHLARKILLAQALTGELITYREFATAIGIKKTPIIRSCVDILEALMREDAVNNRPILAALVIQQGLVMIPRLGFYQMLYSLNLYCGDSDGEEAIWWHRMEVEKLKKYYGTKK